MNPYARTGIGRPIDLGLVSNRIAVIGAILGTAGALIVQWARGDALNLFAAGAVGIGVFLAWAIARELDPDHPSSATIALVLAGAAIVLGPPAAAIAAVILMSARVTAGTVGSRLRPADIVVLGLAAAYAGTRPEAWGAALFLVAAIFVARPPRSSLIATVFAIASVAGAVISGATPTLGAPSTTALGLVVATVVATVVAVPVRRVATRTDAGRATIDPTRVTLARVGTAFSIVGGSVLMADGAVALTPAIAAIAGVAAVRLILPQVSRGSDQDSKRPTHRWSFEASPYPQYMTDPNSRFHASAPPPTVIGWAGGVTTSSQVSPSPSTQ